ncbi:MAG: hypothetical protein ACXAC7_15410 [Candidatus Hodarchaeales archaeon]|jgi:hypothetical protein
MEKIFFKPGLAFSKRLRSHLEAMTVSWTRQKLHVQKSGSNLAYWDGESINIPDLRYSCYTFLLDDPISYQYGYYSALTFHEACHANYLSHKSNTKQLIENIPGEYHNLLFFLYNLIEDGRIERLGLYKRIGSTIFYQLMRLNSRANENNWFHSKQKNGIEKPLNHFLSQLFALIKLGESHLHSFLDYTEEEIINKIKNELRLVLKSSNPNNSINAAKDIFQIIKPIYLDNSPKFNEIALNSILNYHNRPKLRSESLIDFKSIKTDLNNEFIDDPFHSYWDENSHELLEKDKIKNNRKKKGRIRKKEKNNKKLRDFSSEINMDRKFDNLTFPSLSKKEIKAFENYIDPKLTKESINIDLEEIDGDILDLISNDEVIETNECLWSNVSYEEDLFDEDQNESFEKIQLLANKTVKEFLKLACLDYLVKKQGSAQRQTLRSQKTGLLELCGNSLAQLLAGNQYIRKKELPASIRLSVDLILLIDLTGSMECETECGDGRYGSRFEFASEGTLILAETLAVLTNQYNLPINFAIIGYATRDEYTPSIEIVKSFDKPWEKSCFLKMFQLYPQGGNCDARALYESINLFNTLKRRGSRKQIIFFMSDGGGELKDDATLQNIKEEYLNFNFKGPRPYTDVIRWAKTKNIETFVFIIEAIDYLIKKEKINIIRQFYGENIDLIDSLSELPLAFSNRLIEALKIHK